MTIKAIEQENGITMLITDNSRFNVAELVGGELDEQEVVQANSIIPNLIPSDYIPYIAQLPINEDLGILGDTWG